MAYVVVAYVIVAYVVMAYIVMAYVAMACMVMAYVVMACIVLAYAVMACLVPGRQHGVGSESAAGTSRSQGRRLPAGTSGWPCSAETGAEAGAETGAEAGAETGTIGETDRHRDGNIDMYRDGDGTGTATGRAHAEAARRFNVVLDDLVGDVGSRRRGQVQRRVQGEEQRGEPRVVH